MIVQPAYAVVAGHIVAAHAAAGRPLVVGLAGSQGSGKSTLAHFLRDDLGRRGLAAAVVSLDDLYLDRPERVALAARVHPLLATRGVPGTHDVALGMATIDALLAATADSTTAIPRFDKASDRRGAPDRLAGACDVVILEGWCLGAVAQSDADLAPPVNRLEADEDGDGTWRRFVNAALARDYPPLFARIDLMVFLAAPGFADVLGWRTRQERMLPAGGSATMDDAALARFIMHYERLTRAMLATMPARADIVLRLAPDQSIRAVEIRP
ncbi:MAG: hypothetical protein ACRYG4_16265 [Janthinobacterium lividum]